MTTDQLNEWLDSKIQFAQELIEKSKQEGTDAWKAFVGQKRAFEQVLTEINGNNKLVS